MFSSGLDEFEEKIDKLADDKADSDWISQLYSKFSPGIHENFVPEQNWDVPETPVLDTTWGLGRVRTSSKYSNIQT